MQQDKTQARKSGAEAQSSRIRESEEPQVCQSIRIGYACISDQLRPADIFTSRTLTLGTLDKMTDAETFARLSTIVRANLADLMNILCFNEARGIRFFRLSSGIFPHWGNDKALSAATPVKDPRLIEWYSGSAAILAHFRDELVRIGSFARKFEHRITMHPGQCSRLSSPTEQVTARSIVDLEC